MPARDPDHEEAVEPISIGGGPHHGTLLDPRAAMPGSIKHVGGDKPLLDENGPIGPKAELQRRYFEFCYHLAHPSEEHKHKDVADRLVPALAQTFRIPIEEAERRQLELHDALSGAARGVTFGDALRKKNADLPARVARAADFMYSTNPKLALVGLKMLNDMDEGCNAE